MSSPFKNACSGSSPRTSSGGGSTNGTPETRLTTFSPEDHSSKFMAGRSVAGLSTIPGATNPGNLGKSSTDKDPFISGSGKFKGDQKLSPMASSFQPFGLRTNNGGSVNAPVIVSSPGTFGDGTSDVTPQPTCTKGLSSPVSSAGSQASNDTQMGTFSTDTNVTRALKVYGIYGIVTVDQVEACIKGITQLAGSSRLFRAGSEVLIRTSDIRDAQSMYNQIMTTHTEWSIEYIAPNIFSRRINNSSPFVSAHEGQICLVARFPTNVDRKKLEDIITDLISVDGDIYAFQKQLATEAGTLRLIAEYCDVRCANKAIDRLNGAIVRSIELAAELHRPDLEKHIPGYAGPPATPTHGIANSRDLSSSMADLSVGTPKGAAVQHLSHGYAAVLSPTGRSLIPTPYQMQPTYSTTPMHYRGPFSPVMNYNSPGPHLNSPYTNVYGILGPYSPTQPTYWNGLTGTGRDAHQVLPMDISQFTGANGRRQTAARFGGRSSYNNPAGHHNVVDVQRIQEGSDVRTTIMLRNIPNKIDQAMLKSIVDETSFGLYDFMYLRIDFANNCNVGYAFINFEDPYHIIDFVKARSGQRWNRYNSDKVAEVSYATIQGKDCLVQKFRNSSVMLESPAYRPKIFYTNNHPLAGQEEDFPMPDNASKMRRSVENAEHVGLFAPRAGQHYRDEQRRRRSQYDRGTRLAALEDFDYEEALALKY